MEIYIGLDIGGTKFTVAAADEEGDILNKTRERTPLDLSEGLALLNTMIERVAAGNKIVAMGAAIGGPLDWRTGIVSPLHQPQWREVPLKELVEKKWGCPLYVDVDTNVAAIGEYVLHEKAIDRLLYLTVSTGMGGGLLVNGKIYRGTKGDHPEVAHQAIPYKLSQAGDVVCECGASGCLEALVSGNGIRRIYHKPAEDLDDDEWEEVAYNLGQGLRNIAVMYLPDVIVLGGSVALGGGETLLSRARSVMEKNLRIVPVPELRLSRLGQDTALIGALVIARVGLD